MTETSDSYIDSCSLYSPLSFPCPPLPVQSLARCRRPSLPTRQPRPRRSRPPGARPSLLARMFRLMSSAHPIQPRTEPRCCMEGRACPPSRKTRRCVIIGRVTQPVWTRVGPHAAFPNLGRGAGKCGGRLDARPHQSPELAFPQEMDHGLDCTSLRLSARSSDPFMCAVIGITIYLCDAPWVFYDGTCASRHRLPLWHN